MEELNGMNYTFIPFPQESSDWNLSFPTDDFLDSNHSNKTFAHIVSNETYAFYNISENATLHAGDWREAYKPVLDNLLVLILVVVMLSMGCEITWQNLLSHVKRPVGLSIGIFSQFGIMPLSAYCILRATSIYGLQATGVLIISCCPGGVLSNTFTYFCDGDLPLSVAMTCTSTVLAMGMMPLNIWLYGRYFESDDLVIPYDKMAMSLISVTSPVVVGMLCKWKFPRIAAFLTKMGSYSAILLTFVCIAMEVILFPNMFKDVAAKLYAAIFILPIIGLTLGYGLASVFQQNIKIRRTISIECGVQNVPVALTIIALSFPIEMQADIVLLPWLYAFAMMTGCTVICLIYHFFIKNRKRSTEEVNPDILLKQVPLLNEEENGKSDALNGFKVEIGPSTLKNGKPTFEI